MKRLQSEDFFKERRITKLYWLLDTAMEECGNIGFSYEEDSEGRKKFQKLFQDLNDLQNKLLDPRQFDRIIFGDNPPQISPIVEV